MQIKLWYYLLHLAEVENLETADSEDIVMWLSSEKNEY